MFETKEQKEKLRKVAASSKAFGDTNDEMKEALKEMEEKRAKLIETLVKKIEALPDNPRIKRLGHGAFIMKNSDFATAPWSPFYHDFLAQYNKLTEWLINENFHTVMLMIGEIIEKGFVRFENRAWWFHDDVRKLLRELE